MRTFCGNSSRTAQSAKKSGDPFGVATEGDTTLGKSTTESRAVHEVGRRAVPGGRRPKFIFAFRLHADDLTMNDGVAISPNAPNAPNAPNSPISRNAPNSPNSPISQRKDKRVGRAQILKRESGSRKN